MALNKAYLQSGRTSDSDECLTPRHGVTPIIKHLQARGYKSVWCPFDKDDSFYVRELKRAGFIVFNTHLESGQDFFECDMFHPLVDCIVSNPPFSCKDAVLERLYDIGKPFAMLLPQNSLQASRRVNMFLKHGLEYLGFDKRICFYTCGNKSEWKSGNHFASGYFCKDVLPEKLIFEKLQPIQESYV